MARKKKKRIKRTYSVSLTARQAKFLKGMDDNPKRKSLSKGLHFLIWEIGGPV